MVFAARYRAIPVIIGAILAFLLLNTLAVIFGAAITQLVPQIYIYITVTVLFTVFAFHTLQMKDDSEDESVVIKSNRHLILSTFLLITVAEFGDKTQLAVVALSSSNLPIAVWLGSTLALMTTSILGIWLGRTILQKISLTLLHKISGLFFLLLATISGYKSLMLYFY